jgi:hypothetical protein
MSAPLQAPPMQAPTPPSGVRHGWFALAVAAQLVSKHLSPLHTAFAAQAIPPDVLPVELVVELLELLVVELFEVALEAEPVV